MIRTVLAMVVRVGCEEEFERAWSSATARIGEHAGNLGPTLLRDHEDPRRYVISSDWESRQALQAFESSQTRKGLSAALEPLRESAQKSTLDVVGHVYGRK